MSQQETAMPQEPDDLAAIGLDLITDDLFTLQAQAVVIRPVTDLGLTAVAFAPNGEAIEAGGDSLASALERLHQRWVAAVDSGLLDDDCLCEACADTLADTVASDDWEEDD